MKVFKRDAQNTSTASSPIQFWRQVGGLVLFACVYWGVVRFGLLLVAQPEGVASIWPASGLALAVLLLSAKKQWPKLLAVIFVTNVAGNLSGGNTFAVSLGFALANSIEAFLAGWLLTTLSRSKITFQSSRQIFTLFAAAIFGNGLTALLGAAVPALVLGAPFFKTWLVWWSADGLGMILIAPFMVTWATSRNMFHAKTPLRILEGALLMVGLAGFSWLIFGSFSIAEGPAFGNYILFPLLIWLAFRFSPRGMVSDLIIIAVIGMWNILNGNSNPAFGHMTITEQLVNFQIFLIVLSFSGFLMSAIITERKQTEQALRNAEEFNKTIIAHSPIGISVRSRTGGLLSANSAWKNIWGIPEEDYQTYLHHQPEILQFDDRDNYLKTHQQEIRRVYEQGGSLHLPDMKTTSPRPGGAEWVSQHFYAILDDHGRVNRVVILTEDISPRKKIEDEITRNQALMERAQEVAHMGSWELDLTTRKVVASAEAHRIYGLKGDLLTLSEVQAIVLQEYHPKMDTALSALIKDGQEYNVQFKIKRKSDGAIRDIHSRAEYNSAENTVVGSIQDITERMEILQAVMENEEKFRTLFERAHDAIHIDNENDEIQDVNMRACELLGYSREELLRMKVSDLQAPEVRGQRGKTLQGEVEKYGGKIFEGLNQRKDGTKVPVEISVSRISTSQGIRYFSIVRDISDRKRIEQDLREQIDILQRFNDVTVGRELKMIELKKEINALLVKAGEQEKYRIIDV